MEIRAEKIVKKENDLTIPNGSFRLRFNLNEALSIGKDIFKLKLKPAEDPQKSLPEAPFIEGLFKPETIDSDGQMDGQFQLDYNQATEREIGEWVDFVATVPDPPRAKMERPVIENPSILTSESDLTKGDISHKKASNFPASINVIHPGNGGEFVPMGKVKFESVIYSKPAEKKVSTDPSAYEYLCWIVYKGHDYKNPVRYYPEVGKQVEVDFSTLPQGPYRVEVFRNYSKWHAENNVDRYGKPLPGGDKETYIFKNVSSVWNLQLVTMAKGGISHIPWGEEVVFTAEPRFPGFEDFSTDFAWELKNEKGEEVFAEQMVAAKGSSSAKITFPEPADKKSDVYTLTAIDANGYHITQTIQVKYYKTLGVDKMTKAENLPSGKGESPGISGIKILPELGSPYVSRKISKEKKDIVDHFPKEYVCIYPSNTKFSATYSNTKNESYISWVLFDGHSSDFPILSEIDKGPNLSIKLDDYPVGKYRIEVYYLYGSWNVQNEIQRSGVKYEEGKAPKPDYTIIDFEISFNHLDTIQCKGATQKPNSTPEINWGVNYDFNTLLLYNIPEDLKKIKWSLVTSDNQETQKSQTESASGTSNLKLNFPKPEKVETYRLKVEFESESQEYSFKVALGAQPLGMNYPGQKSYVYNSKKELKYSISKFTLSSPNQEDISRIVWFKAYYKNLKLDTQKGLVEILSEENEDLSVSLDKSAADSIEVVQGRTEFSTEAGLVVNFPPGAETYKQGVYIVGLISNAGGGYDRKLIQYHIYEVARNETKVIDGSFFMRPSEGPAGETFDFQVTSWKFEEPYQEESNVNWSLFKEGVKVYDFKEKGHKVCLSYPNEGEFELRAWISDPEKCAKMNVKIETAKILEEHITDSTGRAISNGGFEEKIYIWMKTQGLYGEKMKIHLADEDTWWDDDVMSQETTVGETGIIHHPIKLDREKVNNSENLSSGVEIYPVLAKGESQTFTIDNSSFTLGGDTVYYLTGKNIFQTYGDPTLMDYSFLGVDGKPENSVKLFGTKTTVRVRTKNMVGKTVYLSMAQILLGGPSKIEVVDCELYSPPIIINEEGFADWEIYLDPAWINPSPMGPSSIHYFYPKVAENPTSAYLSDNIPTWGNRFYSMVKVAKEMPSQQVLEGLQKDDTKYVDINTHKAKKNSGIYDVLGVFPLKYKPLNSPENPNFVGNSWLGHEGMARFDANRTGGFADHCAIDLYTEEKAEVVSIYSGEVLRVSQTFTTGATWNTWAIEIKHDIELVDGVKLIARYGEVLADSVLVKAGDKVVEGQSIAKTGLVESKKPGEGITIGKNKQYMLHFELFTGEKGYDVGSSAGSLTVKDDHDDSTDSDSKYERRSDFQNPREFLRKLYIKSFAKEYEIGKQITDANLEQFAKDTQLDVDLIKAFAQKESGSEPFLYPGQAKILFERHVFYRHLKNLGFDANSYMQTIPDLVHSNPTPKGQYGTYLQQVERLNKAKEISVEAAIQATSWGKYQVLGETYFYNGYTSPEELEKAMNSSEYEQFAYYCTFILNKPGMKKACQDLDWSEIGRKYNGNPAYGAELKEIYDKIKNQ